MEWGGEEHDQRISLATAPVDEEEEGYPYVSSHKRKVTDKLLAKVEDA